MPRFLCLVCLKELSGKKTVLNHLNVDHGETDTDNYTIINCDENSSTDPSVSNHERASTAVKNDERKHLVETKNENLSSFNPEQMKKGSSSQTGARRRSGSQQQQKLTKK
eukprot:GFUD01098490.1.p1 GENE.GFUD01098490.1~~GFUD01098490.1.p1  ORF type:complete len:110 (+),score=26.06 GFUD01098490.1:28-357(+)